MISKYMFMLIALAIPACCQVPKSGPKESCSSRADCQPGLHCMKNRCVHPKPAPATNKTSSSTAMRMAREFAGLMAALAAMPVEFYDITADDSAVNQLLETGCSGMRSCIGVVVFSKDEAIIGKFLKRSTLHFDPVRPVGVHRIKELLLVVENVKQGGLVVENVKQGGSTLRVPPFPRLHIYLDPTSWEQ